MSRAAQGTRAFFARSPAVYNRRPMIWNPFRHADVPDKAAAFRRVHELFLSRALSSRKPYPRIPTKKVSLGGFDRMMGTAAGRDRAKAWWAIVFAGMDADE